MKKTLGRFKDQCLKFPNKVNTLKLLLYMQLLAGYLLNTNMRTSYLNVD